MDHIPPSQLKPCRIVQRRDGAYSVALDPTTGVTHVSPLADPPPSKALERVLRLLAWSVELVRSGLVDDHRFIALLSVYEASLLAYLETRP